MLSELQLQKKIRTMENNLNAFTRFVICICVCICNCICIWRTTSTHSPGFVICICVCICIWRGLLQPSSYYFYGLPQKGGRGRLRYSIHPKQGILIIERWSEWWLNSNQREALVNRHHALQKVKYLRNAKSTFVTRSVCAREMFPATKGPGTHGRITLHLQWRKR